MEKRNPHDIFNYVPAQSDKIHRLNVKYCEKFVCICLAEKYSFKPNFI